MWFCPTFERPDRLKSLADAWERTVKGEQLYVRVWSEDRYKDDYFKEKWPNSWVLYESDAQWCGEALQEFYVLHPGATYYGFIGDDVVPVSAGWVETLRETAGDWFVAYPNDTIQRHGLCTHAAIGGELLRALGWWVPKGFIHHYLDQVWMNVASNCGLLRYCPQVVFRHDHHLRGRAQYDAVYKKADRALPQGLDRWDDYVQNDLSRDVKRVRQELTKRFEEKMLKDWEDGAVYCA